MSTNPLGITKPQLSQAEALSYVFQHVTKKRMRQNIDTPSFYYTGLTESRLVGTLELEGNGQGVPYGHGLTILATRSELGQRLADANGLLVEILIH